MVDFDKDKLSKNPVFNTKKGNYLISRNNVNEALPFYTKAIELDRIFSYPAQYKRAQVRVIKELYNDAIKDLKDCALNIETDIIPQFELMKFYAQNMNTDS